MNAKLFYFHDPMCSWCWGFTPAWEQLQQHIETEQIDSLDIEYILGGLAPDNDSVMPQRMQQTLQGYWQRIHNLLDTPFNFDFWSKCQPRRSTYPACRAVIAAANQGRERAMIRALQEAYYLRALNPSDTETHRLLAEELRLNLSEYETDLKSTHTEVELKRQIQAYQTLSGNGFPSLTLQIDNSLTMIPINYKQFMPMAEDIKTALETAKGA